MAAREVLPNRATRSLLTPGGVRLAVVRGSCRDFTYVGGAVWRFAIQRGTGAHGELAPSALASISSKLLTEPVRYGKPGLQAHITYLAGMTANVDQKIGRDAIERYQVLKKELDSLRAEVDRLLGSPSGSQMR